MPVIIFWCRQTKYHAINGLCQASDFIGPLFISRQIKPSFTDDPPPSPLTCRDHIEKGTSLATIKVVDARRQEGSNGLCDRRATQETAKKAIIRVSYLMYIPKWSGHNLTPPPRAIAYRFQSLSIQILRNCR